MEDAWERLGSVASESLDWLWYEFAKLGEESAVFAPLGSHANAAAWLSESMFLSEFFIHRKLGAMLAGFIDAPKKAHLLKQLLGRERTIFSSNPLEANSVGEDIMFAATRWSGRRHPEVREAGNEVLSEMLDDALRGVHWNTAHWAAANLHAAKGGKHVALDRLSNATKEQLQGQDFLKRMADALRTDDWSVIKKYATPANPVIVLGPDDPRYEKASRLWEAASDAER